jgi:hypothetical protein
VGIAKIQPHINKTNPELENILNEYLQPCVVMKALMILAITGTPNPPPAIDTP